MPTEPLLTTAQACARLGVKPATLYAYVSRGLLRSEPGPAGTRERRYVAADVEALHGRREARRDPQGAVQDAVGGALHWGAPVLDSALTQVSGGRLAYRGEDAVRWAAHAGVEETAALLWTGDAAAWRALPLRARLHPGAPRGRVPAESLAYALAHAAAHDPLAHGGGDPARAARTLHVLYAALERHEHVPPAPDVPLHARLARAWRLSGSEEADLLRRALVLLADHELNLSAFAARVAASGGASLPHAALSALSALQGPRHGLAGLAAAELLGAAQRDGAEGAVSDATRRLGHLPGFGHRLYPDGDVRAAALLDVLSRTWPAAPPVRAALELSVAVRGAGGEAPNVDLALAALVLALGRPAGDTLTLFALGRAVGWLAHALETAAGPMIRPRSRYVGRASPAGT